MATDFNKDLFLRVAAQLEKRKSDTPFTRYFPDDGPHRRELYKKHMEFFEAGNDYHIRVFMAANQIGKTSTGGLFEVVCHATGRYPKWWKGCRYEHANDWWCCGETIDDVRDVLQSRLLGKVGNFGSGLIPRECLSYDTLKGATKDDVFVRTFRVKHISGELSTITLKSYEQGRESFQGMPVNILLDEEPPADIMTECLTRTASSSDDRPLRIMMTYTPLKGMSDTIKLIFNGTKIVFGDIGQSTYVVNASWDDAPHVTKQMQEILLSKYPAHQRLARSAGIPTITEGAIYGVAEETFIIAPRELPSYWPRVGGLDVGWNRTAAVWLALDRDIGEWHLYREHYAGQQLPSEHAESIRAKGEWIPLNIDPASRGRSQRDGETLMDNYKDLGLNLSKANNSVEAGIEQVLTLLAAGQLKVHSNCTAWIDEYRRYSRDKEGRIVKKDDHLMDATRYAICTKPDGKSGRDIAMTEAEYKSRKSPKALNYGMLEGSIPQGEDAWMLK